MADPSVVDALNTLRKALTTLTPNERYMTANEASLFNAALAAVARVETALADQEGLRSACEKAIRERRSLEIKEDDWHRAYDRAEARAVAAETERDAALAAAHPHTAAFVLEAERVRAERDTYRAALEQIAKQQPKTIDWLRANGIVFDGPLGNDPDNWEQVAFAIYTDLCEADSIARAVLADNQPTRPLNDGTGYFSAGRDE